MAATQSKSEFKLPTDEEELETVHDFLAAHVVDLFNEAKEHRSSTQVMGKSVDTWFNLLERAYHKIHECEEVAERQGMTTYYGLIMQKVNMTSAFIRSKYVQFKSYPFKQEPTQIVELPDDKKEAALKVVKMQLLKTMLDNGLPQESIVQNGFLLPSVAKFVDVQSKAAKEMQIEQEMLIARTSSDKMTRLINDQMSEGEFDEAMSSVCHYISLYPTAFICVDNESVVDYVWVKNKFKQVNSIKPTFRAIHPRNSYPSPDSSSANDGSFFIELAERSRAQLAQFLDNEDLGYIDDAIEDVLECDYADWLAFDNDKEVGNKSFLNDSDTIHVLRCQTLISGEDLSEYGVDISEDDEKKYFNADIEVCNNRVIKCQIVQSPNGQRTYFSASYKRIGNNTWGVSPAMMIYDRQLSVNRISWSMSLNSYASTGPMTEINAGMFDDPSQIKQVPFSRVWSSADSQNTGRGIYQHEIRPIFQLYYGQLLNEIQLADGESGLPAFLSGQTARMPNGLGVTAMMTDNAVLGLKDCFAIIDMYIIRPAVKILRNKNLLESKDDSIKGDAEVIATGLLGLEQELEKAKVMAGAAPQMSAFAQSGAIPPEMYKAYVRDMLNAQGYDTSKYMPSEAISNELGGLVAGSTPNQTAQLDGRSTRMMQ